MVNLIRREGSRPPWSALDPVAHARYLERLASVRALCEAAARLDPAGDPVRALRLAGREPDLDPEPGFAALEACLAAVETARRRAIRDRPGAPVSVPAAAPVFAPFSPGAPAPAAAGRLLVFEPGLSLATGEAEAASRGLFDVEDRPPWTTWLVAVQRPALSAAEAAPGPPQAGVLAWIPAQVEARAEAGISACAGPGLRWLDALSGPLAEQLGRTAPDPEPSGDDPNRGG